MKKTRIIWQCDSCGGVHEDDNIEGCGVVGEYYLQCIRANGITTVDVDLCHHCWMAYNHLLKTLHVAGIIILTLKRK